MLKYRVYRTRDIIEVAIMPHKDGSGYSYVNLTKGHICPCVFPTIGAAIDDMKHRPEIKRFEQISDNPFGGE